jgi:hypothetical protein
MEGFSTFGNSYQTPAAVLERNQAAFAAEMGTDRRPPAAHFAHFSHIPTRQRLKALMGHFRNR